MKIVKSKEELKALVVKDDGAGMLILKSVTNDRGFNRKMFEYCDKPVPPVWFWDELWLKEVDTTSPVEVGDKVVPFQKSLYGSFDESSVWNKSRPKDQPYLYYAGVDEDAGMPMLYHNAVVNTGDFFKREDFYLYEEKIELTIKEKALEQVRIAEVALATAKKALEEATKPLRFDVQSTTTLSYNGNILFNNNQQCLKVYEGMYEVDSYIDKLYSCSESFQWEECKREDLVDGDTVYAVTFSEPSFDSPECTYKFAQENFYGISGGLVTKLSTRNKTYTYKLVRK